MTNDKYTYRFTYPEYTTKYIWTRWYKQFDKKGDVRIYTMCILYI